MNLSLDVSLGEVALFHQGCLGRKWTACGAKIPSFLNGEPERGIQNVYHSCLPKQLVLGVRGIKERPKFRKKRCVGQRDGREILFLFCFVLFCFEILMASEIFPFDFKKETVPQ